MTTLGTGIKWKIFLYLSSLAKKANAFLWTLCPVHRACTNNLQSLTVQWSGKVCLLVCFVLCVCFVFLWAPHMILTFWVFALALMKALIKLKYLFDYEPPPLLLPSLTINMAKLKVIQCPVISVNVSGLTTKRWHLVKWKSLVLTAYFLAVFFFFSFILYLFSIMLC